MTLYTSVRGQGSETITITRTIGATWGRWAVAPNLRDEVSGNEKATVQSWTLFLGAIAALLPPTSDLRISYQQVRTLGLSSRVVG